MPMTIGMIGLLGMTDVRALGQEHQHFPIAGEVIDHVVLAWPFLDVYVEQLASLTDTDAIAVEVFAEITGTVSGALSGLRAHSGHVALVRAGGSGHLYRLVADDILVACGKSTLCRADQQAGSVFLEIHNLTLTHLPPDGSPDDGTHPALQIAGEGVFHPGRVLPVRGVGMTDERGGVSPPIEFVFRLRVIAGGFVVNLAIGPHGLGPWAELAEDWLQTVLGRERTRAILASGLIAAGAGGGVLTVMIMPRSDHDDSGERR